MNKSLKEMQDKELARLLMIKDQERKTNTKAEDEYWECIREISRRIDIEEAKKNSLYN